MKCAAIGLKKLFGLTDKHINLSPPFYMRFSLIVQAIENAHLSLYFVLYLNWA